MSIISIHPVTGTDRMIVRFPHTHEGYVSLRKQRSVQAALHSDPRLANWRGLIPRQIAEGRVLGQYALVEQEIPGESAAQIPELRQNVWMIQTRAIKAISELHRATSRMTTLDDELLNNWIDQRISVIRQALSRNARSQSMVGALNRLTSELRGALTGCRLPTSRIHGDFWLGNILVDAKTTELTGIVDWDRSDSTELPLHDVIHMLLLPRKLVTNSWGEEILASALEGCSVWSPEEEELFSAAQPEFNPGVDGFRTAILIYWLRHTSNTLDRLPEIAQNDTYMRDNVEQVLTRV